MHFVYCVFFFQESHAQFISERGSTASGRESMMCSLASAHDTFRDLQNNLKEGTKFYNDLTEVKHIVIVCFVLLLFLHLKLTSKL